MGGGIGSAPPVKERRLPLSTASRLLWPLLLAGLLTFANPALAQPSGEPSLSTAPATKKAEKKTPAKKETNGKKRRRPKPLQAKKESKKESQAHGKGGSREARRETRGSQDRTDAGRSARVVGPHAGATGRGRVAAVDAVGLARASRGAGRAEIPAPATHDHHHDLEARHRRRQARGRTHPLAQGDGGERA